MRADVDSPVHSGTPISPIMLVKSLASASISRAEQHDRSHAGSGPWPFCYHWSDCLCKGTACQTGPMLIIDPSLGVDRIGVGERETADQSEVCSVV